MGLNILDWNVWSEHPNCEKVVEFILEQDADVVCLQEVSVGLLERLSVLENYSHVFAVDHTQEKNSSVKTFYLVILTKFNIESHRVCEFRKRKHKSLYAHHIGVEEGVEYHYIDIFYNSTLLRVFNIHLDAYSNPRRRLQQFTTICHSFNRQVLNIVCGDFNIASNWYVGAFNRVIGRHLFGFWSKRNLKINERAFFERKFEKARLKSVFKDITTFPSLLLQLDDILIPENCEVLKKSIFAAIGSDHYPIDVDVEVNI